MTIIRHLSQSLTPIHRSSDTRVGGPLGRRVDRSNLIYGRFQGRQGEDRVFTISRWVNEGDLNQSLLGLNLREYIHVVLTVLHGSRFLCPVGVRRVDDFKTPVKEVQGFF